MNIGEAAILVLLVYLSIYLLYLKVCQELTVIYNSLKYQ